MTKSDKYLNTKGVAHTCLIFFRILKGIEIDKTVRILCSSGPPGGTTDTDNSLVGSLYVDTTLGVLYTKKTSGSGTDKWLSVEQPALLLYNEKTNNPSPSTPLADNSVAIGTSAETSSGAINSIALGNQALTRHASALVQGGGRFSSTGDAQVGRYILRGITNSNSPIELFLDGSQRLILPDNSTWTFNMTITAHQTNASNGHAGYTTNGVIFRSSGAMSTSIFHNPVINMLATSNSAWNINISADVVNGSLKITCAGGVGQTIRWVALVETIEITN